MLLPALDGRGGRRASLPSLSLWQRRRLLLLLLRFFMLFDDRGGRRAPSPSLSSLSLWRRRLLRLLLRWRLLLLLCTLLLFFGEGRSEPSLLHSSDVGSWTCPPIAS